MKMFVIATAIAAISPTLAYGDWQGVAAADSAKGVQNVFVAQGRDKNEAMENAHSDCYNNSGQGGVACKSIAAPTTNAFVVIRCTDGGNHVHMAADSTTREAERVARQNAAAFGRTKCSIIYSD